MAIDSLSSDFKNFRLYLFSISMNMLNARTVYLVLVSSLFQRTATTVFTVHFIFYIFIHINFCFRKIIMIVLNFPPIFNVGGGDGGGESMLLMLRIKKRQNWKLETKCKKLNTTEKAKSAKQKTKRKEMRKKKNLIESEIKLCAFLKYFYINIVEWNILCGASKDFHITEKSFHGCEKGRNLLVLQLYFVIIITLCALSRPKNPYNIDNELMFV